jgi:hypothetical protein
MTQCLSIKAAQVHAGSFEESNLTWVQQLGYDDIRPRPYLVTCREDQRMTAPPDISAAPGSCNARSRLVRSQYRDKINT